MVMILGSPTIGWMRDSSRSKRRVRFLLIMRLLPYHLE
jgi:hypothetical protein